MGNCYSLYCKDCKEYFYLGKEGEFYGEKKTIYCMKDFLISHSNHNLTFGGDEWNCAYSVIKYLDDHTWDFREKGWKEYDDKYSLQDYEEEKKGR